MEDDFDLDVTGDPQLDVFGYQSPRRPEPELPGKVRTLGTADDSGATLY